MEVICQLNAPAALPPGKEPPVPIGQEAGWAPHCLIVLHFSHIIQHIELDNIVTA